MLGSDGNKKQNNFAERLQSRRLADHYKMVKAANSEKRQAVGRGWWDRVAESGLGGEGIVDWITYLGDLLSAEAVLVSKDERLSIFFLWWEELGQKRWLKRRGERNKRARDL